MAVSVCLPEASARALNTASIIDGYSCRIKPEYAGWSRCVPKMPENSSWVSNSRHGCQQVFHMEIWPSADVQADHGQRHPSEQRQFRIFVCPFCRQCFVRLLPRTIHPPRYDDRLPPDHPLPLSADQSRHEQQKEQACDQKYRYAVCCALPVQINGDGCMSLSACPLYTAGSIRDQPHLPEPLPDFE